MEEKNNDPKLRELAAMIDHTNLKPFATASDIEKLCDEAILYHFGAVCVNPVNVLIAKNFLQDSDVKVGVTIGFPLGANSTSIKAAETTQAIDDGAQEVDMVINIGALKDGNVSMVEQDIRSVVDAAKGVITKVIFETCYLSNEEIVTACNIAKKAGADFVKTSTGFGEAGATLEHVKLMKQTVGETMWIKASGGIRSYSTVKAMIDAGATRIGCSAGIKIVEEYVQELIENKK